MGEKKIVETKAQMTELMERLKKLTRQAEKSDEQRRTHWRMVYAIPGSIESKKNDEPVYITTRDINVDGVGFLSSREMVVGQKLSITLDTDMGEVEIAGSVRHCTATVGMYKIGVKFDLIEPGQN